MSRPKFIGFILSAVSLLLPTTSVAQGRATSPLKQQSTFDTAEPFQHPVVLPSEALQALETSKLSAETLRDCAENQGMKVSKIPASWFVGSWIELSGSRSSGLVVRAKYVVGPQYGCFFGAHIAQFWLLSNSGSDYKVVFTGRADTFRILSTRTNGFRDVQLIFIMQAGAEANLVTFKYADGTYKEAERKTER